MSDQSGEYPKDFKSKLNWLIEHHRKLNGEKWNSREIAEAIGSTTGYVHRLCKDPSVNNPSLEVLKGLGRFFGVGLRFFDDDFDFNNAQDVYHSVIGDGLSTRMAGLEELSIEDQMIILRIIDNTIKASKGK